MLAGGEQKAVVLLSASGDNSILLAREEGFVMFLDSPPWE